MQNYDWWLLILFDNTEATENKKDIITLKEKELYRKFYEAHKYLHNETNKIKCKKVKQTSIEKILLHLEP